MHLHSVSIAWRQAEGIWSGRRQLGVRLACCLTALGANLAPGSSACGKLSCSGPYLAAELQELSVLIYKWSCSPYFSASEVSQYISWEFSQVHLADRNISPLFDPTLDSLIFFFFLLIFTLDGALCLRSIIFTCDKAMDSQWLEFLVCRSTTVDKKLTVLQIVLKTPLLIQWMGTCAFFIYGAFPDAQFGGDQWVNFQPPTLGYDSPEANSSAEFILLHLSALRWARSSAQKCQGWGEMGSRTITCGWVNTDLQCDDIMHKEFL